MPKKHSPEHISTSYDFLSLRPRFGSAEPVWGPHRKMLQSRPCLQYRMAICHRGLPIRKRVAKTKKLRRRRDIYSRNWEQASQRTCVTKNSHVKFKPKTLSCAKSMETVIRALHPWPGNGHILRYWTIDQWSTGLPFTFQHTSALKLAA